MFSVSEFALLLARIKHQSASIVDLVLNVFGGKLHSDGELCFSYHSNNCECLIHIHCSYCFILRLFNSCHYFAVDVTLFLLSELGECS